MKTPPSTLLRVLLFWLLTASHALAQTDRAGIGTTTPRAGLDVAHDDGLVATGTFGSGTTADLPTGAGTRLMWVPRVAAFRAGSIKPNGTVWNPDNLGDYSAAFGLSTLASGFAAVALGEETTASGIVSTALGYLATADGSYSSALGVMVSTNGKRGSFVIGDASVTAAGSPLTSSTTQEFSARFVGGYRLFSDAAMTVGVSLAADGGNAWSTLSDSTKKENFRPADGRTFLHNIASMRLGSWNYRGQDARTMRHYGPMAQDFYAAFGQDGIGTVGCDTLINQADFDGVNLIAIQALTREVERLRQQTAQLDQLRARNVELRRLEAELTARVRRLDTQLSAQLNP